MKKTILFHGISPRITSGESQALFQLAKTSLSLGYQAMIIGYNNSPHQSLLQLDTGNNEFVYLKEVSAPNSEEALKTIRNVLIHSKEEIEALICLADFHRFDQILPFLKKDCQFPIIWNGIHDEEPAPTYYLSRYNSALHHIAGLTKHSTKLFKDAGFNSVSYLSYAHNHNIFKPANYMQEDKKQIRKQFGAYHYDKLFFSNFNNIERKNTGNLIAGFYEHVKKYPSNGLLLKTNPTFNKEGTNINYLIKHFNLESNVTVIDSNAINPITQQELALLYHASDFYIQTAYNEGFGTPLAEAHMCGIPVLAPYTGGMKEQDPEIVIASEKHVVSFNSSVSIMYKHLSSPLQIAEALDKAMANPMPSIEHITAKASQYTKENQAEQLRDTLKQAKHAFENAKQNPKTMRIN